jgi:hypothetical protein
METGEEMAPGENPPSVDVDRKSADKAAVPSVTQASADSDRDGCTSSLG